MARIEAQAWKPRNDICLSGRIIAAWSLCLALFVGLTSPVSAAGIGTGPTSDYLLVGLGDDGVGEATAVSNFELGTNTSSVPMSGLSSPTLPGAAQPVFVGQGGNGDIAITHSAGSFSMSNVEIFGDTGIDCAGPLSGSCNANNSGSQFNGSALNDSNGLNENVVLSGVTAELAAAQSTISALTADVELTFSDGNWAENTDVVIDLALGTTVFDIDTGGNALKLTNSNLMFNGPAGAFAIVRIPDNANLELSQSNIIVGNGGIGLNNVLFYTDRTVKTGTHIDINGAIINGIAFWDLGGSGGEIVFNNVQGCTQVIADKINLNDVRLNNCGAAIPEPGTGLLVAVGLGVLGAAGRTGMRRAS